VGRPAAGGPAGLAPLAALAGALFFDLTEKRFKSYEVLRRCGQDLERATEERRASQFPSS